MAAMMRQICKQILTMLACASAAVAGVRCRSRAGQSLVTTIVTDPLTGVAIEGYDPVSYFTEPEPLPGKPDYEYYWGGVPWYFATAANRDVFIRAPEIYAPQYRRPLRDEPGARLSVATASRGIYRGRAAEALSLLLGRQPRGVPARRAADAAGQAAEATGPDAVQGARRPTRAPVCRHADSAVPIRAHRCSDAQS